ncbi:hypothetical protein Vi05172_g5779 [Venturia inaequalis]|uniref:Uncharacterized protein n=1 Tax=Venturia inaequalis TaxID=5025 RepID=A0A8H3ZAI2_VENIN|nr:hypothetical protein EG327_011095 [Venturia inaequalis]RDI84271.1 hypothetical protein Vi05172_g5779 [Venturia inaequalis]
MHLSTLFSNLLVATQLGSYPSFAYAYGRSIALLPDTPSHSLEPRQFCAVRDCNTNVDCISGREAVLNDVGYDASISLTIIRTSTGGVGLLISNGLEVDIRVYVTAFNGQFHDYRDVGSAGVNWIFPGAHYDIWHGNEVNLRVTYRARLPGGGSKRVLSLASSAQGEATVVETRDVPDKSHGAQPLHVNPKGNPKGHQATGVDDKKPKTAGGACPGSCKGASWTVSCRGQCT